MNTKKIIATLLMLTLLCSSISACRRVDDLNTSESDKESAADEVSTTDEITSDSTENDTKEPEPEVAEALSAVDIDTIGGIVIVGEIRFDGEAWYIESERPMNISFEYFLDSPSIFLDQTRIKMFDPSLDGIEKAIYIGQTVTAEGTLSFYRDDFETLYFAPYTITIGKNAEHSYAAPDLVPSYEPVNLYDPSIPLPKYMDTMIEDGEYFYNAFMLSREALEFMGNDFAVFYVGFVDAVLSYQNEFACPDKRFAEMLSTIIYYEFPLYNAVAEPFEFFRHYDAEKGTVYINYKYEKEEYDRILKQFFAAANDLLSAAKPGQSDEEMARNLYHALASRMTYDYSALEKFERKDSYYAYLNNSGVCVTFANVYNQLLTQVGIETTLADCDSPDTIGHTWSIITLDGKQYFCDPTYELSYDSGNGYRFYGMNYADRTADGLGAMGIRYGRYYVQPLDPQMIADESLS